MALASCRRAFCSREPYQCSKRSAEGCLHADLGAWRSATVWMPLKASVGCSHTPSLQALVLQATPGTPDKPFESIQDPSQTRQASDGGHTPPTAADEGVEREVKWGANIPASAEQTAHELKNVSSCGSMLILGSLFLDAVNSAALPAIRVGWSLGPCCTQLSLRVGSALQT